jgi:DNA-binding transcriptional LysR family regulator
LFFLAKYLENASKSQHARRVNAALAGLGLAHLPEDQVQQHIAQGRLVQVLADWRPPFLGYHLYYPSRRQTASA